MKKIKNFIKERPILAYLTFNYLISWAFLIPCYRILLNAEEGTFPILALIGLPGAYGPSIAALLISRITEGSGSIKRLLKKAIMWKLHAKWYLFIFLMPLGLLTVSVIISSILFEFSLGKIDGLSGLKVIFPFVLIALPFGPMGEELGWRGYLLPKLLDKFNPSLSSLFLGTMWTVWHIASFGYPGAAIPSVFKVNAWTIFLFFGTLLGETFLFTYIYMKTKGSVFLAILFHAVFNASSNVVYSIFPDIATNVGQRNIIYTVNLILLIIVGIFFLLKEKNQARHLEL